MTHKPTATLLLIAGLWVSASSAGLISKDLDSAGDGLLTSDESTGLEWLDFSETTNSPWNAIVVSDALGSMAGGFFAPSISQLTTVFVNAGAVDKTASAPKVGVWRAREVSQVPEPAGIGLLGIGLGVLGFFIMRRRARKSRRNSS